MKELFSIQISYKEKIMKLALILLNYNDYENTIRYIEFVRKYGIISNIIVVDNCSTNDSLEKLREYSSEKVVVINSEKNGGYAYGNNRGIEYARVNFNPDYFIISNPDVYFEENSVKKMIAVHENNSNIAIVAPRVINNKNSNEPVAWKLPRFRDNICMLFITLNKIFKNNRYYNQKYFKGDLSYVDVIPGSFFMIKAEIFYEINMFDEGTFLYGEENIISYKLKERNYINIILNNVTYLHEHSVTINKEFESYSKKYKILYNSLDYYNKTYLKTGIINNLIFLFAWKLSNLEKLIISFIKNFMIY